MRKNKFLNLFLVCLIMANVLAACTNWDDVAIQRDNLVTQLGTEQVRMKDSKTEVKNRSGNFPTSYTQATESLLATANDALANIGSESTGWLGELNDAIQQKDKKVANDRLERIQTALDQIRDYTNKILGPPDTIGQGLYSILQAKVDLLHNGYVTGDDTRDLLHESKDLDGSTWIYVQAAAPFNLCGSQTQMSFKDAHASYGNGVATIRQAEQLISEGDEPAASDALVDAMRQFSAASGSITTSPTNHQLAADAISAANASKVLADLAYLFNTGDYIYTVASEISSGDIDLGNALTACQAEDFLSAVDYADSAEDHFNSAVYWSTEEEEEVYIPPADNNDPIDPWSYESEDTTPNDDDTWEYEPTDDSSWDYEPTDDSSWDYEPTDDSSWDYEPTDDSSWDYDSTDDSSWDNSLYARREEVLQLIKPLYEWILQK